MSLFSNMSQPMLMGILNVTPDSFSDGGAYTGVDSALAQAQKMLAEGADMIDIGGESTRPGSEPVSAEEQIKRVVPVIQAIRANISANISISIDTTLSTVAAAAIDAGATLINDVSAGLNDKTILSVAAERDVPIILMHMQGQPKTMQIKPGNADVVSEVLAH